MQTDPASSCGAAEYSSDLGSAQSLPSGQHEYLAIVLRQDSKTRPHDQAVLVGRIPMGRERTKLFGKPYDDPFPTLHPSVVVCENVPRGYVEPQQSRFSLRDLVQSTPCDLEDLSHDIRRVLARGRTPQHVSDNPGPRRLIQPENRSSLGSVVSVISRPLPWYVSDHTRSFQENGRSSDRPPTATGDCLTLVPVDGKLRNRDFSTRPEVAIGHSQDAPEPVCVRSGAGCGAPAPYGSGLIGLSPSLTQLFWMNVAAATTRGTGPLETPSGGIGGAGAVSRSTRPALRT